MKKFLFLGWCYEAIDGKVLHDKIWGALNLNGEEVTFWGKRGAKPTFKKPDEDVWALIKKKRRKYIPTTIEALEEAGPGFEDRFDEYLVAAQLGDAFHRKP